MEPIINYKKVQVLRRELVVLRDVDFTVMPGEMIYLVGRVGSGKSSLLRTIYADVPIEHARCARVFDYDLCNIQRKYIPWLRRNIGIVFQDFQLLQDRNVHENLRFVLRATGWKKPDEIEGRIEEVLNTVGMLNKSYKMPVSLSGGEQQRVAIARAILNKPAIILADEPTGNLDPETGELIARILNRMADEGTAVIMATHNPRIVEDYPARVMVCQNKRLYEQSEVTQ